MIAAVDVVERRLIGTRAGGIADDLLIGILGGVERDVIVKPRRIAADRRSACIFALHAADRLAGRPFVRFGIDKRLAVLSNLHIARRIQHLHIRRIQLIAVHGNKVQIRVGNRSRLIVIVHELHAPCAPVRGTVAPVVDYIIGNIQLTSVGLPVLLHRTGKRPVAPGVVDEEIVVE